MKINSNYIKLIIFVFIQVSAVIVFYGVNNSAPDGLQLLWVLPLTYGLLLYYTNMNYGLFKYLGITILNIILFARYVLSPLFSVYSKYYYHSGINSISGYMNVYSIILMLYEMICIFLVFHYGIKNLIEKQSKISNSNWKYQTRYDIYMLFFFIGLIAFMSFPAIRDRTNFLVALRFGESSLNTIAGIGMIFTQASLQALFLITVIIQYKNKLQGRKINKFVVLISTFAQITIFWSTSRIAVLANGIVAIALLNSLRIVSKKTLGLVLTLSITIILSITTYTAIHLGGTDFSEVVDSEMLISDYFQAYFGGQSLIAISIAIDNDVSEVIDYKTFINEIISSILFVRQIFPPSYNSPTVRFNHVFGYYGGNSMILPTLGQSYLYFGFLGAPILSIIFSLLLYKGEMLIINAKTIGEKYALYLLVAWLAFFPQQNLNIVTATVFNVFLPFYLLARLNKKYYL